MKNRELKLKDIAGYLPYGLNYMNVRKQNTFTIFDHLHNLIKDSEYIKPILRPLSDLYKPITHNGKEQTPILELAKMQGGFTWRIGINKAVTEYGDEFYYYGKSFVFNNSKGEPKEIIFQYELFDYLQELKIDYRGLIDAGLAISVYDLDKVEI